MSDETNSIPPQPVPVPPNTEGHGITSGTIPAMPDPVRPVPSRNWEPPPPEELHVRLPQYEITEMIGQGGMGAVYKGWQKSLGRPVAIKILPAGFGGGGNDFAVRFKREARAQAQLSHPGIIHVHDAGEKPDGLLYFVMDFVTGTDLQKMLVARGRLPVEEALGITVQILDALGYAHGQGVVHRDIKPANIMIENDGTVKIADFGLATSTEANITRLTSSNVSVGTPDFMAPEAMKGGADVDHRADIYAVGAMLYEMLTGSLPRGRFNSPSRAVPALDKRLDRIVDRALQPDREARYSSAAEFRAAIAAVIARPAARRAAPRQAAPARAAEQRTVPRRKAASPAKMRPRTRALLAGVVALAVLGTGAWLVWKNRHDGAPSAGGKPAVVSNDPGGKVPKAGVAPWNDAFTEPPLLDFILKAEHAAQGYLLPKNNHWKYPAQPVLAGALRVRATSEDSRMILNFHHDDGGSGGVVRILFRPGKCLLAYNVRSDAPNTMLAENDDVKLGESAHDFLLMRIAGRFRVLLDGRTIIEAADPKEMPGRFSIECGLDNRLHLEKAEYIVLDGLAESAALKLLGLNDGK